MNLIPVTTGGIWAGAIVAGNSAVNKIMLPVALTMSVAAIIWGATVAEQVRNLTSSQSAQDVRIERMDSAGTRALSVIDDRQKNVIHRLDVIEQRLDRLERIRSFQQQ